MAVVIGLTGGIATGKSTVANMFRGINVEVIDSDRIVHNMYLRGKEVNKKIIEKFGEEVSFIGHVNRKKLATLVYSDKSKLRELEEIVHPEVRKTINQIIDKRKYKPLIIVDIPLLYESKMDDICEEVICVSVSESNQIKRLMKRDNIDKEYALKKISYQMPLEEKFRLSKYNIQNDMSILDTKREFNKVIAKIKRDFNIEFGE